MLLSQAARAARRRLVGATRSTRTFIETCGRASSPELPAPCARGEKNVPASLTTTGSLWSESCSLTRWSQPGRRFVTQVAEPMESESPAVEKESFAPDESAFEMKIPLNAYYLCKDISIDKLRESPLFGSLEQTARSDYVTINITPLMGSTSRQSLVTFSTRPKENRTEGEAQAAYGHLDGQGGSGNEADSGESTYCTLVTNYESSFVVAFRYGGVVFFNVEDSGLRDRYLEEIGRFTANGLSAAQGWLEKPSTKAEDFSVIVDARQREWSRLTNDHLRVRCLDMNNIVVISSVLGQSVALDHYHTKADAMLKSFSMINIEMERTGNFKMPRKALFQIVAQNNTTYSDSITKIKLLEKPSEAAWKYAHYGAIWEQLRGEFELEERFQRLSLKLELMQQNVKYFLEILQNRKSDTLEWIIIILIAGEIILSLYDIYDRTQEKKRLKEMKRRRAEEEEGVVMDGA